jgi:methylmalonic aciduria homocystinuria type C protein
VPTFATISTSLATLLDPAGFDVLGAVSVGAYNSTLSMQEAGFRLPDLRDERDLVLVIGSTRRLWPLFLEAYATTSLGSDAHPFDAYSRTHIGAAVARIGRELGLRDRVRYSFDRAPEAVAIQRLASLAGVGEVGPINLCIHPAHGPWFSLRAAVMFDVEGPAPRVPDPTCSVCADRPCVAARAKVLTQSEGVFDGAAVRSNWLNWLAMRDACPVGRTARYSEEQIRYHYLKERAILDKALSPAVVAGLD